MATEDKQYSLPPFPSPPLMKKTLITPNVKLYWFKSAALYINQFILRQSTPKLVLDAEYLYYCAEW